MAIADRTEAAREALERNKVWYHTIELAPGVVSPGQIDLRRVAPKILPDDLRGKRALDIGTFDGFWAFEMERRGAEVVAIDVETIDAAQWPPLRRDELATAMDEMDVELGRGFELAQALVGSSVRRVLCDVNDLTPETIGGRVDIAFMGALLVHLRDPVGALEKILASLVPGGELLQLELISARATILSPRTPLARFQASDTPFNWWLPNVAALARWLQTAGFVDIRGRGVYKPPQKRPMNNWYRGLSSRRPPD